MAYDRSVIIAGIHKRLGACPRSSLAMICKEMGVGRHTAQRALRHGASHPGGGAFSGTCNENSPTAGRWRCLRRTLH